MQKGGRTTNPLWMSPDDAAARGLVEGSMVQVHNVNGALEAVVAFDDALLPGVVAMSQGWGNRNNPGLSVAQSAPGATVTVLLPTGPSTFSPLPNHAPMTSIPIRVHTPPPLL